MANMLTKIPGLSFMYSGTYEETITGTKRDSIKINNVNADVYIYQNSKNVSEEIYIMGKREKLLYVLASSGIPYDQLMDLAIDIDNQSINLFISATNL